MTRLSVVGGGVLLTAALLWSGPAAAQTANPLDTAQALQLLRESAAALEASDRLRFNNDFQQHLAFLFRMWGEEWSPPPQPQPPTESPVPEVTDSLAQIGQIDRALALALEQEGRARQNALYPVLFWMAGHGQADRALAFSDSVGTSSSGVMAVLNVARPMPARWRAEVDRISRFLRETSRDSALMGESWRLVVGFVAERDFERALDIAQAENAPVRKLLTVAIEQGLPIADSLLLDRYKRVMSQPATMDRASGQRILKYICDKYGIDACDQLDLPENPYELTPLYVADRLRHALDEGRWRDASAIGDTLRDMVSTERYAIIMAETLERVVGRGRGYESVPAISLPRLDSIASRMTGPSADTLNARLAGLWAASDPDRARGAVARIGATALRATALTNLARASYSTNAPLAFEALRQGGSGSQHLHLPSLYVQLRLYGDTARAEQTYEMLKTGTDRMIARLGWAEVMRRTGRWPEAYQLAFEALAEWDPSSGPIVSHFLVFVRLGVYDELIAWARARETADARAVALASVVRSVAFFRPRRTIH